MLSLKEIDAQQIQHIKDDQMQEIKGYRIFTEAPNTHATSSDQQSPRVRASWQPQSCKRCYEFWVIKRCHCPGGSRSNILKHKKIHLPFWLSKHDLANMAPETAKSPAKDVSESSNAAVDVKKIETKIQETKKGKQSGWLAVPG